jgi:hypothetical protein
MNRSIKLQLSTHLPIAVIQDSKLLLHLLRLFRLILQVTFDLDALLFIFVQFAFTLPPMLDRQLKLSLQLSRFRFETFVSLLQLLSIVAVGNGAR